MLNIQVIPNSGADAYRLLRDKVTHEARTWAWSNKAKTRLRHKNADGGYIEVGSADGVLVAQIRPRDSGQLFFLTEKFIGRLTAWFVKDLIAINIQFTPDAGTRKRRRSKRL